MSNVQGVVLDDGYKASEGRTGSNHWLKYDEDDVVQSIGKRIADIVGLPLANAESMQIIHYGPRAGVPSALRCL
jgi:prolyl 4-hydroxylase